MASITEVYETINGEVTSDTSIGATSTSKTAEYRLITYTITAISKVLAGLWDIKKRELQKAAEVVPSCNSIWWADKIRAFQFGHELRVNDNLEYYYLNDDPDARIVDRVAVYQLGDKGSIKVAKAGPTPLSEGELAALRSYKNKILPLGSNIIITSQEADVIKIVGSVYYDAITPLSSVRDGVSLAINSYLADLEFNVGRSGTFYTSHLTDRIQEVRGVIDFVPTELAAGKMGDTRLVKVERKYVPVAGYIRIHPDFGLSSTLTFAPES